MPKNFFDKFFKVLLVLTMIFGLLPGFDYGSNRVAASSLPGELKLSNYALIEGSNAARSLHGYVIKVKEATTITALIGGGNHSGFFGAIFEIDQDKYNTQYVGLVNPTDTDLINAVDLTAVLTEVTFGSNTAEQVVPLGGPVTLLPDTYYFIGQGRASNLVGGSSSSGYRVKDLQVSDLSKESSVLEYFNGRTVYYTLYNDETPTRSLTRNPSGISTSLPRIGFQYDTTIAKPTVETLEVSADDIFSTSTIIKSQVTVTDDVYTQVYFEWGTDSNLSTNVKLASAGLSTSNGNNSLWLQDLIPETIYYYRAKVANQGGGSLGNIRSFTTTAPLVPGLTNLKNALAIAAQKLVDHVEGKEVGQASATARTALQSAINTAQAVVDSAASQTQEQLNAATEALQTAVIAFEATVVKAQAVPMITTAIATNITSSTASAGGDVTSDGGSAVTERGVVYSTSLEPTISDMKVVAVGTMGVFTVNLSNLSANTPYHYRAYAQNSQGISYGADSTLTTDVKYLRVGPSYIDGNDVRELQLVGQGFNANSPANLSMYLKGKNNFSNQISSANIKYNNNKPNQLTLSLPPDLPIGSYDLYIEHGSYDSKTFTKAVTLTNDYDSVEVNNVNYNKTDKSSIKSIILKGPFVKANPSEEIYTLGDTNKVVNINDILYFKGKALTIDKRNPNNETISGNGRLYIKVEKSKKTKNKAAVYTSVTVQEGSFKLDSKNFEFNLTNMGKKYNYLGLDAPNLPIKINSFKFISEGIRLTGTMDVELNTKSATIIGSGDIKALDFKGKQVDLKGVFSVDADFKKGPLEKAEAEISIDTKNKTYGVDADTLIKKTQVGIHTDFIIKNKKLDTIGLIIYKKVKIPNTGIQFTSFGGKVEHLTSNNPVYHALTSLSDYTSPVIKGKNMININEIDLILYEDHIAGNGKGYYYDTKIGNLDLAIYYKKVTEKIKKNTWVFEMMGMDPIIVHNKGIELGGRINIAEKDILVGDFDLWLSDKRTDGIVRGVVKIPNSVPLIGGEKIGRASIDTNEEQMKAGLSIIGVGFKLTYTYKSQKVEFKVNGIPGTLKFTLEPKRMSSKSSGVGNLSLNSKSAMTTLSPSQISYSPQKVGEKLFDQMNMQSTARGKLSPGYATTLVTETNPVITIEKSTAKKVRHTVQISTSYRGLILLNNASENIQILQPNGEKVELRYIAANSKAANAIYDVDSRTLTAEIDFNQVGNWSFIDNDSMGVEIHQMMYRNPNISIGELTEMLLATEYTSFVPLELTEAGMRLIQIDNAKASSVLIKPDGQVYASVSDIDHPAWNTFVEEGSEAINIVAEVAQTGTWLVDAGEDALVSLYNIRANVPMSELKVWKEASQVDTSINFSQKKGKQVWMMIQYATPDTKLFKSDGTQYQLDLNPTSPSWNAKYDEGTETMSVLTDVNVEGIWTVKSADFTSISLVDLEGTRVSMTEYTDSHTNHSFFVDMDEKGRFFFHIAGGNETTQIIAPNGQVIPIISDEDAPDRNAILGKDNQSLKVTVNVMQTGVWQISSNGIFNINLYKLAPIPEVDHFKASKESGLNQYELSWKMINPQQDTKVRIVLTDNPDTMIGEVIATDLPASGVRTFSLPDGLLPKHYFLVLIADSESFGPIYKVMDQPILVTAKQKLVQPQAVTVTSTGDGVIKLAFKDANWQNVTSYRVFATDARENLDNGGGSVEVLPAAQEQQSAIVSNLVPGISYNLSVMAFYETEETLLVSDPTEDIKVDLPIPDPATLTSELNVFGSAKVEHIYSPEDLTDLSVEEQKAMEMKITISSATQVAVNIGSDQNASIELFVNGESVGIQAATVGKPASFTLKDLSERDYSIVAEAVNAVGDHSSFEQLLYIDRTAPYLSVSNAVYGQVMDGSRVKLTGISEPGVRLTINNVIVPVDPNGRFAYVIQFPDNGVLPLSIVARNELGYSTEQQLVIFQGEEGDPGEHADLAALALSEGELSSSFESNVLSYSVELDASTKEVQVWAVPAESDAVVQINGITTDEEHSAMIELPANSSTITVVVQAADQSMRTYTLELQRTSSLAALSDITLEWDENEVTDVASEPQLSPSFSSSREAYMVVVANNVTHTRLIPTNVVAGSLITVNGIATSDGQLSANIPLLVGDNRISIQVISLDESKKRLEDRDPTLAKTYTITVTREASSVAELKSLTIDGANLSPAIFDATVDKYKITVAPNVNALKLHTEAVDPAAVVKVNDSLVNVSGVTPLNLVQGMNIFNVNVIAKNGNTMTYTIEVFKQTAVTTVLNLKSLSIVNDELDKEFSPWQLNYRSKTGETNNSIMSIQAVPVDSSMLVSVNGIKVNTLGNAAIPLHAGDNTLLIKVETQDGLKSKTYAIRTVYTENYTEKPPVSSPEFSVEAPVNGNHLQSAINGLENNQITKVKEQKEGDTSIIHLTLQSGEIERALSNVLHKPTITIPVNAVNPDKVILELTAKIVELLKTKDAILDFRTNQVAYNLPASSMNIAEILRKFGAGVKLEDVIVQVLMTKPSKEARLMIEQATSVKKATIISTPMDFQVVYKYKDQVLDSEHFTQYVERSIALPDGADPASLTTGVRVSEDGSLYHVPTYVTQINGLYWAHMKSYTNSMYVLISRIKTFDDIKGHWSQIAVEDLSARLVIEGKDPNHFEPNLSVTRAEFTAMIMRSLGIAPNSSMMPYQDVSLSDWYGPIIAEASTQGLILGYADHSFRPDQGITRAEAATIISKAWVLAGKKLPSADEVSSALGSIKDQADIQEWARSSMAIALHLNVMRGYEDLSIKPSGLITRAEVATLLRNMLIQSELIQP